MVRVAAAAELRRIRIHGVGPAGAQNPYNEECATELATCIDRILDRLPEKISEPPGRFPEAGIEAVRRRCDHQKAVFRTNHIEPEFSKRHHEFELRVQEVLAEKTKEQAAPDSAAILKVLENIPQQIAEQIQSRNGSASELAGQGNQRLYTAQPRTKKKRSTERGEARAKIIAALTKHHNYADGSCLNLEPIGNNQLARQAGVSASTVSAFFNKEFEGNVKYRAVCRNAGRLADSLKLLNGEFAPHILYGRRPPDEDDRDPRDNGE